MMSKPDQTPMDQLLSRSTVDERERSPDDDNGQVAEDNEPEAFEGKEPLSEDEQAEQPTQAVTDQSKPKDQQPKPKAEGVDDEGEGEPEGRRMSGLPKWAFMRIKANDAKADAAERRAAEAEQRLQALEAQMRGGQTEDGEEQDWTQWTTGQIQTAVQNARAEWEREDWNRRNQAGWDRAVQAHGHDLAANATAWAKDAAESNYALRQQIMTAYDPVAVAISEFRKAQFNSEAEKFGFDIDKMIAARTSNGQQQPAQQQPQPDAGVRSGAASQPQQQTRMPSDFASTGSGAGRVNGDTTGPTPLGELLQLNQRRR